MLRSQNNTNNIRVDKSLYKKAHLNVKYLIRGMNAGAYRSLFRSNGIEYAESKPYVFGDDARHIDWTLSNRMSTLHTKYFHEEKNRVVWFLFDISGSMNMGAPCSLYDVGAEAAYTLMQLVMLQKDKVGGVLFDSDIHFHIRPSRSSVIVSRLVENIEKSRFFSKTSNLFNAVSYTQNILTQRALVVVVSDFMMDDCFESLSRLVKMHDVFVVRTHFDVVKNMPSGGLSVSDTESSQNKVLSLTMLRKQCMDIQSQFIHKWKSFCLRYDINGVDISTEDSVLYQLVKHLRTQNKKLT